MRLRYTIFLLAFGFAACGRETEVEIPSSGASAGEVSFTLSKDVVWANTGVKLDRLTRVKIEPTAEHLESARGRPEANFNAPLPTEGTFGLIARIGENGLPVAVGDGIELQGNSIQAGEYLFLGRNGSPADFSASLTSSTAVTDVAQTKISAIETVITVEETTAPALLSPVHGFFTRNISPTFDWDDVENAVKYVFELSRFPDFREQVIALDLGTGSSVSLASFQQEDGTGQPTIPGQNNPAATLDEGVYYWRVRSQQNVGRTIAPTFKWTDHSPVFRFGVETESDLPSPQILAPAANARLQEGAPVVVEFTQLPDASGLFWRYRSFLGACGSTLDSVNSQETEVSPWFVFRTNLSSNIIGEVPKRYAAHTFNNLEVGNHLVEIEVVDAANGVNLDTTRAGVGSVNFSVGCQN